MVAILHHYSMESFYSQPSNMNSYTLSLWKEEDQHWYSNKCAAMDGVFLNGYV